MAKFLGADPEWNRQQHNATRKERRTVQRKRLKLRWCEGCKQNFTTLHRQRKYCSDSCASKVQQARRENRDNDRHYAKRAHTIEFRYGFGACGICSKSFPRMCRAAKYCSSVCARKARAINAGLRNVIVKDHRDLIRDPD